MTAVTYTAKRSIISGHIEDTNYSINLAVMADTPGFTRETNDATNTTLDGSREVLRYHAIKYYDIHLAPLKGGAALDVVLEFLDSVEGGETFGFDFYGTVASPASVVSATLDKAGYSLDRYQALGTGGAGDYFTLSFRVRVVVP